MVADEEAERKEVDDAADAVDSQSQQVLPHIDIATGLLDSSLFAFDQYEHESVLISLFLSLVKGWIVDTPQGAR
jgi:hypothetical protein